MIEKDDFKTVVIFRKWKCADIIIAVFPEHPDNDRPETCSSYGMTGQHSGCNYSAVVLPQTVPAKRKEYLPMKEHLERSYGYKLIVRKRVTQAHIETRRSALREIESR